MKKKEIPYLLLYCFVWLKNCKLLKQAFQI